MPENSVLARTFRRSAQAGVILLVYYLTLIGGFATGMHEYKWRMITLVILGLLWGGWFLWRVFHRSDLPITHLEYPLLVMLSVSVLATTLSADPRLSGGRLAINIALAISFYFTLDWMKNEWRAQLLLRAILITGALVCIIGFIELWQWYGGTWFSATSWREAGLTWTLGRSLRVKSVLHGPNGLAYFLVLLAGLTFYQLSLTKTTRQRVLWGSYLVMVMVTAILTQSRGGLLGMFATTATFVTLFVWSRAGNALTERRIRPGQVVWGGLLFILLLLLLLPVVKRTNLTSAATLNWRDDMWKSAIRAFLAHPVLGAGPASFPSQYMVYRSRAGHDAVFAHAHNMWFTILAEYGISGVLAVSYFCIMLARVILRYLRQVEPSRWSGQVLAGVSILAGQGVHNLVDDFVNFLPTFTWFIILSIVLCLLPICGQHPILSRRERRMWLILVGSGMLIIVVSSLWYGRAFAAYDRARQSAQDDDWLEAVRELEKAVELDPAYHFYRQQLALAYGELARIDDNYLSLALAQQTLVYDQSHSYPPDIAYLACLHWESANPERAIELMRMAISNTPLQVGGLYSYHLGQATMYFNLGYYLESVGEFDLAQQAYAQVLLAFPQAGTSSYWDISEERRRMLQSAAHIAQRLADDTVQSAEIAFNSGDYQAALKLYSSPVVNQVGQAKSLLAIGQPERAHQLLFADSSSHRAEAYLYQSQILMSSGHLAEAEATIRKAVALSPTAPSSYYYWGYLAELQGDYSLAKDNYLRAVAVSTSIRTDYAYLVGHRQPLPTEQPFCLMVPYPAENLSKPSLALANLLMIEQNDPSGAMAVYQNLLRHEPYNQDAQQKLTELLASYPTLDPEWP